jgi:alpha/beta superfamily hydrolase
VALIPGPAGSIDACFHIAQPTSPVVLMVPPHPVSEGPMTVQNIQKIFMMLVNMNYSVISFNYRGIGYSSGSFVDGEGEIADASACLDWIRQKVDTEAMFWILGLSYGAYPALQVLMRRPEINRFITIDMDTRKEFSFLAPCPVSGMLIQTEHGHSTHGADTIQLTRALSFQNPSNAFLLKNIDTPNMLSDCFFPKVQDMMMSYMTDPEAAEKEPLVSAA